MEIDVQREIGTIIIVRLSAAVEAAHTRCVRYVR